MYELIISIWLLANRTCILQANMATQLAATLIIRSLQILLFTDAFFGRNTAKPVTLIMQLYTKFT